ncbi:hypothetical protein SDC9_61484 [bioreactor metagenome]|uniref:Glycerophosphoryl diester phosphodiesterase membrane domain-containing protein n=1 Tax=bioreactor metagenome TaxID=1076179 RepID=A0A644XH58_9ZZZZ
MIDENTGVGRSIDRSFALAKGNRWFIFGLLIVLSLMIYLVILGIGMLVGLLINFVGSTGFGYGMDSFAFVALVRVLTGVVTLFGTGLVMLVLSVQYHNLKERLYAPNLEKCVDEIGKTE